ncbi:probable E3 ubiquitin-protein ligase RNF217 isoform X2 [Melanotaenia boesemani]|uniref:probable E3 ubiquitin-protein ligase RNF217 isoform X2 n=1 Tax=Melanotaenia boesemani TaxID=1250792 RepID=UPI001C04B2F8|nr:probable E3 ubiquitin-protein ligase RNF217 isoform X2 [Melanotaenia boesemani]
MWKLMRNETDDICCILLLVSSFSMCSFRGEVKKVDNMSSAKEKCYNPRDFTLRFVDREDEFDFLCEGFSSRRALMSCGHAVTPTSLTNWCRQLLEKGESKFVCGQFGCNAEWPYVEVRKMALLTHEEREYFERNMALNAVKVYFDTKVCPECKHTVTRKDQSNLSVRCHICTARKGRVYEFCWQCLKKWKGDPSRTDRCENEGCYNEALKTLRTCSVITFESVKGVTGCPSIRACPTCGYMLEHSSKNCKSIYCSRCKTEFCFVCLKLKSECKKTGKGYYNPCSDGVAPRQTSIPVWQRR